MVGTASCWSNRGFIREKNDLEVFTFYCVAVCLNDFTLALASHSLMYVHLNDYIYFTSRTIKKIICTGTPPINIIFINVCPVLHCWQLESTTRHSNEYNRAAYNIHNQSTQLSATLILSSYFFINVSLRLASSTYGTFPHRINLLATLTTVCVLFNFLDCECP